MKAAKNYSKVYKCKKHFQRAVSIPILLLIVMVTITYAHSSLQSNTLQDQITSVVNTQTRVTLELQNVSIEEALEAVTDAAEVGLSYNADYIPDKTISVHFDKTPFYQAVEKILQGTGLQAGPTPGGLALMVRPKTDKKVAQETITGTVTNAADGTPLPGVNVIIQGTTTGTATELDGSYELLVPSIQDTLVYSFIGFQTQVVPINGRTEVNVEMVPQTLSGEEMVVVGYGTQRKVSLIGAQSSLANEEVALLDQSSGSLTNSLSGRLPGVVGVQRSGLPGSDASDIWIRGISSFGDSSPLILVDGVERPMNSLNPDDIKSLTILKDASATAIYGTRGANGVIIIKTKTGLKGKPTIDVDYFEGVTTLTQVPDMADGITYMRLANEASMTRGGNPIFSEEEIQKTISGENPLLYPNVDWMNTVFDDYGRNRQLNASISGGSSNTQYYVSLTYYNEKGLITDSDSTEYSTNTNFNKYNLQSNVTVDITPSTEVQLGVGGYLEDWRYPAVGIQGIFDQAMDASPVVYPIMYPGGRVPGRNPNGGERNPYADAALRGYEDGFHSQLFSNMQITQELDMILEGLSVRGLFGFDTESTNGVERGKRPNTYYIDRSNPFDVDGSYYYNMTYEGETALQYSSYNNGGRSFHLQGSINYERDFGSRHRISGLLLYLQTDESNPDAATFAESIPHREQSVAFRATYSYDNRYFFEANFGYSGSENFAPENRFGFFPSVGVGWVISNEKFFEPLSGTIDFLKVRYSDGYVGATGSIDRRFAYLTLLSTGVSGYTYGLNNGAGRGGINVSEYGVDVRWAEARKQNLGVELRAFDNRLSFVVNFFKQRREGILLRRSSVPNFVGLTSDPYGNLGVVENKGFDGQLMFNSQLGGDFNFSIRTQFTYNKDTIIENDQAPQPYPWMDRRGENVLAIHGYKALGLFESQEEIDNHATQFGAVLPGDIKYKDLNGDGVINSFDQAKIARGDVPYLTLGAGIALKYKAFDLQAFFQGQFGAEDLIGGSSIQPFQGGGGRGNLFAIAKDRWSVEDPDPNSFYPRLAYGEAANYNNTQTSSFWMHDLDFVRLKELEFGYTLPMSITGGTVIKDARIYFRGQNMFLFSSFDLWDPELNTPNGTSYPLTTVYSVGFDIQF